MAASPHEHRGGGVAAGPRTQLWVRLRTPRRDPTARAVRAPRPRARGVRVPRTRDTRRARPARPSGILHGQWRFPASSWSKTRSTPARASRGRSPATRASRSPAPRRRFAGGRAALERERPDVLITDLELPDGNGLDLIRAIDELGLADARHGDHRVRRREDRDRGARSRRARLPAEGRLDGLPRALDARAAPERLADQPGDRAPRPAEAARCAARGGRPRAAERARRGRAEPLGPRARGARASS